MIHSLDLGIKLFFFIFNFLCVKIHFTPHALNFFFVVIFDFGKGHLFFFQSFSVIMLLFLNLCVKLIVNWLLVLQRIFQGPDLIFITCYNLFLLSSGLFVLCTDIVIILFELLNFKLWLGFKADQFLLIDID